MGYELSVNVILPDKMNEPTPTVPLELNLTTQNGTLCGINIARLDIAGPIFNYKDFYFRKYTRTRMRMRIYF